MGDGGLRLQLYRRLANLAEESEVAAVGTELADRFGPLPRPLENLLYQLRVKIRARRAGVNTVASENGQIVLILPPLGDPSASLRTSVDQGYLAGRLGPGVRVSKNKIWLPRAASETDWRGQLLDVLARLEAERSQGNPPPAQE